MIKMLQRIPTHKKEGSDEVVFSEQSVSYRGCEIAYSEAEGLTFSSSSRSVPIRYTSHGKIVVRGTRETIKIKISDANVTLGASAIRAVLAFGTYTNYHTIVELLSRNIGPHIVSRLSMAIRQGQTVRIGSLEFDVHGITGIGLFGTRRRASWDYSPEVRSTRKAPWYSYTTTSGIIEISYHYPATGAMILIGKTSSAEENGCLVPLLIETVKRQLIGQC